ncbi:MAG: hypothetical protein C4K58_02455 [Flavobacteriaceae bacterium]|nr:MAG: hypothetical protein C4K58_02455 [Flavobacteriaceae bacterium]
MKKIPSLVLFISFLFSTFSFGQFKKNKDIDPSAPVEEKKNFLEAAQFWKKKEVDPSVPVKEKNGFLVVAPYPLYSVVTGFSGNLTVLKRFKFKDTLPTDRFTSVSGVVSYSENGQKGFYMDNDINFPGSKIILKGAYEYWDWNETFFGVGNNTTTSDGETLFFKRMDFKQAVGTRFKPNNYAFLGLTYFDIADIEFFEDKEVLMKKYENLNSPLLPSTYAGVYAIYEFDTRDNFDRPQDGIYANISAGHNLSLKDVDYASDYSRLTVNATKYLNLSRNKEDYNVVATQIYGDFTFGDAVPFHKLAGLGNGTRVMRGQSHVKAGCFF